ncbi:MAG: MFS transporter [Acidimicrobiales bacterium]
MGAHRGRAVLNRRSVDDDRLLTPAFVLVTGAALAYFVGLGILAPVLPRYVEDELGGGGLAVGAAVGAFAVSAALLRPAVGRIGDERGRRVLVVAGGLVAGLSILGYELADGLAVLIGMRLLTGAGEAAMFVGAATAVQDMAPPQRRGEAASYFSVAVYGGLGVGPVIGDLVREHLGFRSVWLAAALTCVVAALLATRMPGHGEQAPSPARRIRILHPAALRPGAILALSTTGYAGFAAFVPLYIDQVDVNSAGPVFAEYAAAILVVRILGAKLPDRLGPIRAGTAALALQATGFAVLAGWGTAPGLYTGTLVYSLGVSLLYPALFPLVVAGAPEDERSQAVATFTLFFDVSQGLGAFALGAVVSLGNERWAFAVAGVLDVVGFVLLRRAGARAKRLAEV